VFLSNSRDLAVDETAIGAALVRFQRGDDRVPRGVRPVIEESWRRCLRVGIDPVTPRVPRHGEAARPRSARNQELLEASHAVMEQARTTLEGCGTMLVLADATGVVLHAAGDDNALATAEGVGLTRGSNWSEPARGTSGLGTSLYLGDALHVHGPEHYCRTHQRWTCSASVVRDPVDDGVLGALSVAGPSEAFDPHLFPLVLASAAAVRAALSEQEDARRKQLLEHALALLSRRSTTTGLMLFDRRGAFGTRAGPRSLGAQRGSRGVVTLLVARPVARASDRGRAAHRHDREIPRHPAELFLEGSRATALQAATRYLFRARTDRQPDHPR